MLTLTYGLQIMLMGRDDVDATNAIKMMELAKARLRNLGYDPELPRDEDEVDSILIGATRNGKTDLFR